MLTDEQAALIAASIALQNSELARAVSRPTGTSDLGTAIHDLGTTIYVHMREWKDGREHDELQEQVEVNRERLRNR